MAPTTLSFLWSLFSELPPPHNCVSKKAVCLMKMLRILNQQRQHKKIKNSISFVWRIIFKRDANEEVHWLPLKLSLLSTFNENDTEKFAIHEIRRRLLISKKFHFHYWHQRKKIGRKNTKKNIWIKSFHDGAHRWKSAYRRAIIVSQLRISIASRDQIVKRFLLPK